ncbi:expressed unknown protein [Seminavis robusta]|uniref:Uncharacterized protein n=1 Tax=Seminavis robusta TaxID=568900 RepID=A0A9N8H6L5_9STRA|nr:expressed unknown protein [Seminavis robusta]|eukprot:Sro175_g076920.1 n/a (237) ;mRNA; r:16143-16853
MVSTVGLKKIQAASGLVMGLYVALHLFNHYKLNASYEQADAMMMSLRKFYRHPIYEISFVAALLTHFYTNCVLYTKRSKVEAAAQSKSDGNKKSVAGSLELKAHRIAGYTLSVLVLVHAGATRITPLLYFDDPNVFDYSFGALVIPLVPFNLFSVYYMILGIAGGWHLLYGTRAAIATLSGTSVVGTEFPMLLKSVAMMNHILIVGAVAAMGKYAVQHDWSDKKEMHDRFLEVMGM